MHASTSIEGRLSESQRSSLVQLRDDLIDNKESPDVLCLQPLPLGILPLDTSQCVTPCSHPRGCVIDVLLATTDLGKHTRQDLERPGQHQIWQADGCVWMAWRIVQPRWAIVDTHGRED